MVSILSFCYDKVRYRTHVSSQVSLDITKEVLKVKQIFFSFSLFNLEIQGLEFEFNLHSDKLNFVYFRDPSVLKRCNYNVHIFQIQRPTFFVICTLFIRLMVPTVLIGAVKPNTKVFKNRIIWSLLSCLAQRALREGKQNKRWQVWRVQTSVHTVETKMFFLTATIKPVRWVPSNV